MTVRYSVLAGAQRRFPALYGAQLGDCFLCGVALGQIADCTREHVWPRHPTGRDMAAFRERGGRTGSVKNELLAHRPCNMRKGNRLPHPCEVIYLEAVNARLYGPAPRARLPRRLAA